MEEIAYTTIIDGPKVIDGETMHYRLVVASSTGGYSTLKETGDPTDPFYVAKAPIWFSTRAEAEAEAARRNEQELGLSAEGASRICLHSVAGGVRRGIR